MHMHMHLEGTEELALLVTVDHDAVPLRARVEALVDAKQVDVELAYQLVTTNGRVPGAFCANSTSSILKQIPGFEQIEVTYYPVKLQEQFAALPGVETDVYYEDDSDDLQKGLAAGNATLNQDGTSK